jgi:hypothetical protein
MEIHHSYENAPPINWDTTLYGKIWQPLWYHGVHPPWPYHQLLSNLLTYVWIYQNDHICEDKNSISSISSSSSSSGSNNNKHNSNTHSNTVTDIPSPMPELKEYATVMNEFCLDPTDNINPNNILDIPFYEEIGTNKSNPKWNIGEDVIGNNKPGWWLDNPKGGNITFRVRLRDINPIIGVGYLQSYEKMGKVRIYIDDLREDAVYIDALDTSQHVSVLGYQRLCKHKNSIPNKPSNNNNYNNSNNIIEDSSSKTYFPFCEEKVSPKHRYRSEKFNREYTAHTLNFELLPSKMSNHKSSHSHSSSHHNKFKIMYIVTC